MVDSDRSGFNIYSGGGNAIITVQESTPQANFTLYGNPNNFAQLYLYDPANGNSSQASISPNVNALNQAIGDTVTTKGKSKLIVWRQHTDDTQSTINPF